MLPIDVMLGITPDWRDEEETEYAMDFRDQLETAFAHIRQNAKAAAERQKRYYYLRARGTSYKEGDLV